MYFNLLLPLFVREGNDGNYVPTAACDLHCLQVRTKNACKSQSRVLLYVALQHSEHTRGILDS